MSILTALNEAKGAIAAVALIGGGIITLDSRHEPKGAAEEVKQEFDHELTSIQSDLRVDRILALAKEAKSEGSPDYLCNALDEEIISLCSERPDHYLCNPETQDQIKAKAGCQ